MASQQQDIITITIPSYISQQVESSSSSQEQQFEVVRPIAMEDPEWAKYLDDKMIDHLNQSQLVSEQVDSMLADAHIEHLGFMEELENFYTQCKMDIQSKFEDKMKKISNIKNRLVQEMNDKAIIWKSEALKRKRDEIDMEFERLERIKKVKYRTLNTMARQRRNKGVSLLAQALNRTN